MIVWRVERSEFIAQAYHGHGAARYPGRWNLPGSPAAYASESRALAVLETLTHIPSAIFNAATRKVKYFLVGAEIPDDLPFTALEIADVEKIHSGWHQTPGPDALKAFGHKWLEDKKGILLQVPSTVIPEEKNFVINPRHPDFVKIKIRAPVPYIFDSRLRPGEP